MRQFSTSMTSRAWCPSAQDASHFRRNQPLNKKLVMIPILVLLNIMLLSMPSIMGHLQFSTVYSGARAMDNTVLLAIDQTLDHGLASLGSHTVVPERALLSSQTSEQAWQVFFVNDLCLLVRVRLHCVEVIYIDANRFVTQGSLSTLTDWHHFFANLDQGHEVGLGQEGSINEFHEAAIKCLRGQKEV